MLNNLYRGVNVRTKWADEQLSSRYSHQTNVFRELSKRKDPITKLRKGQVIGAITNNISGIRMAHSVVDKVFLRDVICIW